MLITVAKGGAMSEAVDEHRTGISGHFSSCRRGCLVYGEDRARPARRDSVKLRVVLNYFRLFDIGLEQVLLSSI